jgi:glucuronosyltransferase
MKKFVEAGKKGCVLVSLGSNIRSDQLDDTRLMVFINTMQQLPAYNFIWKFESDVLPGALPRNVMITPWLPQNDILGHPNTKAFVTHSGLLGTQESIWHGVPMVGIPFIADQHRASINKF